MDFSESWWEVANESEKFHQTFLNQLQLELPKGHMLYGLPITMLAKSESNDDILVAILDGSKPNGFSKVAQVHLTWKKDEEILPYPLTTIYENFEQWKMTITDG